MGGWIGVVKVDNIQAEVSSLYGRVDRINTTYVMYQSSFLPIGRGIECITL